MKRQPNYFRSEALENKLMEQWKASFASHDPDAIEKANSDFYQYLEALLKVGDKQGAEAVIDKFHAVFANSEELGGRTPIA